MTLRVITENHLYVKTVKFSCMQLTYHIQNNSMK